MATPGRNAALIDEARTRWTRCSEAEQAQRASILLAKQFRAGEQWDPALKAARQGGPGLKHEAAQPARPCLVVDRLSQPVRQTSNTIKNASFSFDVLPNGAGADTDTAEIFKGYMRRVHNNARGESPVEWAADGAIEAGLGWFRLRTEYVHQLWDGDVNDPALLDQEVRLERITNSLSVYCDPSSLHPTRKDAQYMFVVEDLEKDHFQVLYPDAEIKSLDDFLATGDLPGWVSTTTIRRAEYWHIEYDRRTFCQLVDGTIVEKLKGGPTYPKADILQERAMRVPRVTCDVIDAVEVLESYEWVGTRIPLFPILGEELNVDGTPVLRGIIQEGMDAQRMVNYTYSGAMELFALEPKSPWIAEADTIADYKAMWQTSNIVNYAYLPWTRTSPDSTPPTRTDRRGEGVQAAVALMQVSEEAIKATTSVGDPALGNTNPRAHSGRAIQALQGQSDLANSNYPDNVRRALIAAAEEMAIVIPRITRKGQILHILGVDDKPEQVMVGQPFQPGPDGVPQPSPPDITPAIAKLAGSLHKFYDLNFGRYSVTVTVGKATATKREEGAAALGDLIPHLPPEMAAVATPDFVEQLSFPGAQGIADKLRLTLPPHLQNTDKKPGDVPPQIAAMVQQLQQQLQQATQALQTDQAKQQATIQRAQIDAQVQTQTAQADAQVKLQIAQLEGQMAVERARVEAQAAQTKADTDADRDLAKQVMENAAKIAIAHIEAAAKGAALQHAPEETQALGGQAPPPAPTNGSGGVSGPLGGSVRGPV